MCVPQPSMSSNVDISREAQSVNIATLEQSFFCVSFCFVLCWIIWVGSLAQSIKSIHLNIALCNLCCLLFYSSRCFSNSYDLLRIVSLTDDSDNYQASQFIYNNHG